jgi:hypothetical protein
MKQLLLIPMLFVCYLGMGQSNIIGTPITIGTIEVAQKDFPTTLTWYKATDACTDLGDGWRLPTAEELDTIYKNQTIIDGFIYPGAGSYWSSTGESKGKPVQQNFENGVQTTNYYKFYAFFVRAVRDKD